MPTAIRFVALSAMVMLGAYLAPANAADSRLDDARAHLVKAKALVAAAEPSSNKQGYLQHTKRAQQLIDQAEQEIDLAKAAGSAPAMPQLRPGNGTTLNPSGLIQLNPQPEPPLPKTR